jgi:Zn-dependent protease
MLPQSRGSFPLFRVFGINVYLHWSWLVIAVLEIQARQKYSNRAWNVLEYLTLFFIVLLHEFGHALACRSVGGAAHQIVLWPLGGVAYVNPPPRPGPVLWSIAAGPLVNLLLVPVTLLAYLMCWPEAKADWPDYALFAESIFGINLILLIFNLLPVYPLDGGQILQALLWFFLGRARSMLAASFLGLLAGVATLVFLAYQGMHQQESSIWFVILAVFVILRAWIGVRVGLQLLHLRKMPRHEGFACPACGAAPLKGPFWQCGACHQPFDVFETNGHCPECSAVYAQPFCFDCQNRHPVSEWCPEVVPAQEE